ncbi:MAG: WG repeat-containing protein [Alistipes sp.]|nr:WG repeat-containing protein [Alistipes sp.]
MKRLTQIFQALLGVVALILTALIAAGRLAWRTIRNWWKTRSKWLRRSIVAIFILVPVGFVALVAYVLYEDKYGRDYYDRRLSDNITLHSFSDNKWRVYDKRSQKYITDKLDWVVSTERGDSLAVYAQDDRRGFLNIYTGEIAIDAEANDYRKAWVFSDGLAAVMRDGKIGFINANNEVVIPFRFDYSKMIESAGLGYVFHDGYCVMTNAEGKMGVIGLGGHWIVPPIYEQVWPQSACGYRIYIDNEKYGVLGTPLECVYAEEYDFISINSAEETFTLIRDGRMWKENFCGEVVQPFLYESTYYLNYPIGCNECGEVQYAFADFVKYEVMNSYGIMNRITGEPITPAIYSDINMLSEELFEVQEYGSYDRYLLDSQGNVVPRE